MGGSVIKFPVRIIRPFDPWKSKLCTCPAKYSLNPYTGCPHRCLYCYSSSYIPRFFSCRPKRELVKLVEKDVEELPENALISMSNTSDPYPEIERELELTRRCLEIFREHGLRVLIITKGDVVLRDLHLLSEMRAAVTLSVTTRKLDEILEPGAPKAERRMEVLKILKDSGIPVGLRLDPVIPFVNDSEIEEIISSLDFVDHVVSSTFKPRADSWKRISLAFPEVAVKLRELYFSKGERIQSALYLPREMRRELMLKVREVCHTYGIPFASCREGFPELQSSKSCDGSHLIR